MDRKRWRRRPQRFDVAPVVQKVQLGVENVVVDVAGTGHRRVVEDRGTEILAGILIAEIVRRRESQVLRRIESKGSRDRLAVRSAILHKVIRVVEAGVEAVRNARAERSRAVDGFVIGAEPSDAKLNFVPPRGRVRPARHDVHRAADGAGAVEHR